MTGGKLSKAEQEALKERSAELKAQKVRKRKTREDAQADILAKIAEMPPGDKEITSGLHKLIMAEFEVLWPKTWYGMPAYTLDGKVFVFLSYSSKWGTRYSTLSFEDIANLDNGPMWPTGFAITEWNSSVEQKVRELIKAALETD